ncbi:DUF4097 family beta strand repeat-containing protein [Larkinella terrae]|uniref:DUF4097 domain-containing protein n=1 Tax=Larkinella terrae TaxID=2025311 RepID=A0A7K0ES44_9BACT|nr:hypothetical protein [Larkinella terrae]MRS64620.1 hypothetical protein [Larkinella terrae]
MKPFITLFLVGLVAYCIPVSAQNQEFKDHISKEFTLSKDAAASTLAIYNISGFIKVEGYSGTKVVLEIDRSITAKTAELLEQGKKEFLLQFDQDADTIMAYIAQPYDSRPNQNNWRNNGTNHRRIDYKYHLDFTVKVPYSMNLHISTVNAGDVTVKDVTGSLHANNVNGAIKLTNIKGATNAHTINGNVEANYLSIPPEKSKYYTLNGDIKISYPANLSADLSFKSFQGEFYTDFPDAEVLPVKVTKTEEKTNSGTVYKLSKDAAIRIGKGGQTLRFETFNGNVYIKKQS